MKRNYRPTTNNLLLTLAKENTEHCANIEVTKPLEVPIFGEGVFSNTLRSRIINRCMQDIGRMAYSLHSNLT